MTEVMDHGDLSPIFNITGASKTTIYKNFNFKGPFLISLKTDADISAYRDFIASTLYLNGTGWGRFQKCQPRKVCTLQFSLVQLKLNQWHYLTRHSATSSFSHSSSSPLLSHLKVSKSKLKHEHITVDFVTLY